MQVTTNINIVDKIGISLFFLFPFFLSNRNFFSLLDIFSFFLFSLIIFLIFFFIIYIIIKIINSIEKKYSKNSIFLYINVALHTYLILFLIKNFILLINYNNYNSLKSIIKDIIIYYFDTSAHLNNVFRTLIIIIFIIIFLRKKYNSQIIKIITVSGFIFFIINTFNHFYFKNYNNKKISDERKELTTSNNTVQSFKNNYGKKVIWILFDEFDHQIAFNEKNINYLKNFEKFKNTSFFHKSLLPPARNTNDSIPAQLLGLHTNGHIVDSMGNYFLLTKNDNNRIKFNFKNSIFYRLHAAGFSSAIYSSVLNYCKFIYFLSECKSQKEIENTYYKNFKILILKLLDYSGFYDLVSKIHKKVENNQSNISRFSESDNKDFWKKLININHINEMALNDFDGRNTVGLSDLEEGLNKKINFIFIHILLPHLPFKHSEKIFDIKASGDMQGYLLNLKLADFVLESALKTAEKLNNKDIMIIASSDHWLRSKDENQDNYYPALFIAKILNDNSRIELDTVSSAIYIQELIYKYFEGEISDHRDISSFFNSRVDKSKPYIKKR